MLKIGRYALQSVGATVATAISFLFGCVDGPLTVLVAFMVLDYGTGVLVALLKKQLSSRVGMLGLVKKATILLVLITAVFLDRLVSGGHWVFRTVVCYFYIANEGISILENCGNLGVPIPKKLKEMLEQLKEDSQKDPR